MQFWINVLVLASTYALLGIGYVLVYRASRVLNLAHGELMMLAAYGLFSITALFPGQPGVVIPLTLVAAGLLGAVMYRTLVRPMAGRPLFSAVLLTVALAIVLEGLVVLVWTPRVQYPADGLGIADQAIHLPGGGVISALGIASVVTCGLVLALLGALFRYSRVGIHMLAAAENPLLVAQRGIDFHRLFGLGWGLAVATAAIAGVLYALTNRLEGSLAVLGLKAFPAVLVGGLGSLAGVLPGALLVATAEVAAIQLVSPQLSNAAPFLILLLALLIRPWGLLGRPEEVERV